MVARTVRVREVGSSNLPAPTKPGLNVEAAGTIAELKITDGELMIDIKGLDQLLGLRSSRSIPLANIKASARARAPCSTSWSNLASTDSGRGWAFFMVSDPEKASGIDIEHGSIRRVVVEVDGESPEEFTEGLRAAIRR